MNFFYRNIKKNLVSRMRSVGWKLEKNPTQFSAAIVLLRQSHGIAVVGSDDFIKFIF